MSFIQDLNAAWGRQNSLLCVGLDPEPSQFPAVLAGHPDPVFAFCKAIVDATAGHACAFKPQIAHFAALAAEDALARLIAYIHEAHPGIPVILDAKRGDIGSTAARYAVEAFDRYQADAVTLNPYLGRDSAEPFLDRADKGVILLCHTSNPGAADLQDLDVGGLPLYQHVAKIIADAWNYNGNCALVTGATWPGQLGEVRQLVGAMPLLVPGIGAQGGDVAEVIRHGCTADGLGLMISSSRAIIYAGSGEDYALAAGRAARDLKDLINVQRNALGH
ncbi:orotidine-5'-phosphate decarboxylase [Frateuria aurantia]